MQQWSKKQNHAILWGLGSVLLLAALILIALSGGNLLEAAYFWAFIVAYLWLPGGFWYRMLKLEKGLASMREMLTLLFGVGFFSVCYCFAGRFGLVWLLRVLPLLFAIPELYFRWREYCKEKKPFLSGDGDRLSFWFLLWAFCCLIYSFYMSVMNADPSVVGQSYLNQDMLWNVGNAESFKIAFPPQDIRFSMVRLAYHYLTELCAGALSWTSGVSAYRVFAFYAGAPVLFAVLLCVRKLGLIVYHDDNKKALWLGALTVFGGSASLWTDFSQVGGITANTLLVHVITNINSQATAIIFISVFSALFVLLARKGFDCSLIEGVVFAAAVFMMTFAKGPEAVIVVCAFAIVMLIVLVFQKPKNPVKAVCLAVVGVVVCVAIYFSVFASGANTSVYWSNNSLSGNLITGPLLQLVPPFTWQNKVALVLCGILLTVLMQPFSAFVYLVSLPRDVLRVFRLEPEWLLARGTAIGGMMAYCVLWHESSSQIYFAFAAFFFMNLLAVDRFSAFKWRWLKRLACAALCVSVATAVMGYSGIVWRGSIQVAANLGYTTVENEKYSPALAEDVNAMEWLRENMPVTDRFATNRIHTAAWRDDGISNLYSAFSGRQAYMEGYTYAYTNEGVAAAVINERVQNNTLLFNASSTAQQVQQTCKEIGVQWLVFSVPYPGEDAHLAAAFPLVYANEAVRIYKVS